MMKQVVAVLLCMMVVFGFAGFTTNASAQQKVVIWAWDQNLPSINYAVEKYQKSQSEVTEVDVQSVPDTVDKMATFLAAGIGTDLPDIVLMDNLQIQAFLQQFPDQFVNLSEMGFDEFKDSFSAAHWDVLSHEGSLYAFPFDIAPVMMAVNTEILSKAGVDPDNLKTWADVIAATPAIKDAGYATHIKLSYTNVLSMMQSAGVGIFDKDRNIDLLNPKTVEIIDLFMQLTSSGASDPILEENQAFGDGKVAMQLKPAWMIGEDMPMQPALDGKVKLIPMPKVKDVEGYTSSANDGGSSFFILAASEAKQIAYDICTIITTDMQSQDIALAQGLMPGNLKAVELDSVNAEIPYYQGQRIWKMLSESSADTPPVAVNEYYAIGKEEVFKNVVIDPINKTGTDKSAKELLQEAAELLASQTGLQIKQY